MWPVFLGNVRHVPVSGNIGRLPVHHSLQRGQNLPAQLAAVLIVRARPQRLIVIIKINLRKLVLARLCWEEEAGIVVDSAVAVAVAPSLLRKYFLKKNKPLPRVVLSGVRLGRRL